MKIDMINMYGSKVYSVVLPRKRQGTPGEAAGGVMLNDAEFAADKGLRRVENKMYQIF